MDRPSARRRAAEADSRRFLPYARHATPEIVVLDGGGLMTLFRLEGIDFETGGDDVQNAWHARLNQIWRNLSDDRLAIWHHVIRRPAAAEHSSGARSLFAQEASAAYESRLAGQAFWSNELLVALVLHPGRGATTRLAQLLRKVSVARRDDEEIDAADLQRLETASGDFMQHLAPAAPRRLGLRKGSHAWFSEPMEVLSLLWGGPGAPVPLIAGRLADGLHTDRIIFGREALEVRGADTSRYGAMLAVKEYPSTTRPGLWNALLAAPFAFVCSQSFGFLSKPHARTLLERKQNQMVSAQDRAASQVQGLAEALDDLVSNRFVMGEHQASLMVYADTPAALTLAVSRARAILAESGLVVAREDLALEAGFWAQFPGVFASRTRPAAVTSRNFAALAPLNAYSAGRSERIHWGEPVCVLRTSGQTAYHFNFHVADVGHTFICGPSGSGKTVVQNFLLAQLERFGAQRFVIDKDRGADIFVRASGGDYFTLRNGEPTGFAPFRRLGASPADLAFLSRLVRLLVCPANEALTAPERRAIDSGVAAVAALPPAGRSLSALRTLLGQADAAGLGARLERWQSGGPLGWVLDNARDTLDLDGTLVGVDVSEILDHEEARAPAVMYLLHRMAQSADGRRLVVDIDEFWKVLGDPAFTSFARDGLKTWRKRNAMMVFGTQSPADALASPIASAILDQCATKIFLPNPDAQARDYIDGFGLSPHEFHLVRDVLSPESRRFLIRQDGASVVAELDLRGLDDILAILSGTTRSVALLDRLRAEHGEAYAAWRAPFHQQRTAS